MKEGGISAQSFAVAFRIVKAAVRIAARIRPENSTVR